MKRTGTTTGTAKMNSTLESHSSGRTERRDLVKVRFPLSKEDTEMGVEAEALWAQPLGDNKFKIDNIPFYVYGISNEDVVSAKWSEERFQFQSIVSRGGHSTYRVLIKDPQGFESEAWLTKWAHLAALGCSYEVAKRRWIAIDVPTSSNADEVYAILEQGEADGAWSIDEGHCGHPL